MRAALDLDRVRRRSGRGPTRRRGRRLRRRGCRITPVSSPDHPTSTLPPRPGEVSIVSITSRAPAGIATVWPPESSVDPTSSRRSTRVLARRGWSRLSRAGCGAPGAGVTEEDGPGVDLFRCLLFDGRRESGVAKRLLDPAGVEPFERRERARFGGPVETTSTTPAGRFRRIPASGSVPVACHASISLDGAYRLVGVKPLRPSSVNAAAPSSPATYGTPRMRSPWLTETNRRPGPPASRSPRADPAR